MTATLLLALMLLATAQPAHAADHPFVLQQPAEVVASITASCARCDWAIPGREAVLLEVNVDGAYSQHVLLVHATPWTYRIMLGRLEAGPHRLGVRQDAKRSAAGAGDAVIGAVAAQPVSDGTADAAWLSRAPFLRARPGTVERFSDLPLVTYAEADVPRGEGGHDYRLQFTTIFSNEDGGTPPDRLMATWGRTTDIEFVLGVTRDGRELIQTAGHAWADFHGARHAGHPELWVETDNNMVADHGPADAVRFGVAPVLATLAGTSREAVMDREPWTYALAAGEMRREGRVSSADAPPAGSIVDPRRYAVIEACADVTDAVLALDLAVASDDTTRWFATDARDARFKIARGGCFRAAAALPEGAGPAAIQGLRVRAVHRPDAQGPGRVVVHSVNRVFMLDRAFAPVASPLRWAGTLEVPVDGPPTDVPPGARP